MNISFATLLSIRNTELTDFGAIMSGNVKQATIANLSSHFSVTRGLIEDDIDFICLISRQHSFDNRFGLQKIEAAKFCRQAFCFARTSAKTSPIVFATTSTSLKKNGSWKSRLRP